MSLHQQAFSRHLEAYSEALAGAAEVIATKPANPPVQASPPLPMPHEFLGQGWLTRGLEISVGAIKHSISSAGVIMECAHAVCGAPRMGELQLLNWVRFVWDPGGTGCSGSLKGQEHLILVNLCMRILSHLSFIAMH